MYDDNFTAYLDACTLVQRKHPEWRWGQTLFNVLYEMRPDLSEMYRGEQLDPFYNDRIIDAFLESVEANWNDDFGG